MSERSIPETAPEWPEASPGDVRSVDAIIAALYQAISFEPGQRPDWDRLRSLFHPEGRLVPPRGEEPRRHVLDVESFIARSSGFIGESGLRDRGFFEREIGREVDRFGHVVHAFSAYESLYTADDPEPFSRGINSIQLVEDEGRFWVLNIVWDVETEERPIPSEYVSEP